MTEKQEIIYMAGFMDGEGWIGFSKRYKYDYTQRYTVEIQISQVNIRPLKVFQKHYGGSFTFIDKSKKREEWLSYNVQDIYHWHIGDKAAEKCLRDLLPFLILKKKKAELALQFRETGRLSNIGNIKQVGNLARKRAEIRNQKIITERKVIYGKFKSLV